MKLFTTILVLCLSSLVVGCENSEGKKVQEINFDLGRNIVETARNSGVPEFSISNVNGSIEYSVTQVPQQINARFTRKGYEVAVGGLFAFSLDANRQRTPDDLVYSAGLQLEPIKSHDSADDTLRNVIGQFKRGKWKRFIRDACPAVTGRSSILNEGGGLSVDMGLCVDPDYQLTREEWRAFSNTSVAFEWVGDGVIAKLNVRYDENSVIGTTYDLFLEFEQEAVQRARLAQAEADDIKTGEAKGWGTAAKAVAKRKEIEVRNKVLEANAIKRGDRVAER